MITRGSQRNEGKRSDLSADSPGTTRDVGWRRGLAVVVSVVAAVIGVVMVLLAATVGHCGAFGGTCPADPPPPWEDDVVGTAAAGAALVIGPLLALRRGDRRWTIASAGAAVAAVVVGLAVGAYAHG